MLVEGGCHCGAVRFRAEVAARPLVLDCNCSICAMAGYRHVIVPHENVELLAGRDHLTSYRFGTGAAVHLFCRTCGIKSFYQPRSHPHAWSLNLRALHGWEELEVEVQRFDGRNWEQAASGLADQSAPACASEGSESSSADSPKA